MTLYPPNNYANTVFENATAPMRDVLYTATGTLHRFYYNGTAAKFDSNNVFQLWLVPPVNNTFAPIPTNTVVTYDTIGTKIVTVNNVVIAEFYPPPTASSSQIDNSTGVLYKEFAPLLNLTRVFYRNGSSGVQFNNGTFIWTRPPVAFFVPFT